MPLNYFFALEKQYFTDALLGTHDQDLMAQT